MSEYKIKPSSRYKKLFKRIQNDSKKVEAVNNIISMMEKGQSLPAAFYDHDLKYDMIGYKDCHPLGKETDFVLIYKKDEKNKIITLYKVGNHAITRLKETAEYVFNYYFGDN